MIIIGAGGFAIEVLETIHQNKNIDSIVFYDDVNLRIEDKLYNKFLIIKNINSAKIYFESTNNNFTIGLGNPRLRKIMFQKFNQIGGNLVSTISPNAQIGSFGTTIGMLFSFFVLFIWIILPLWLSVINFKRKDL